MFTSIRVINFRNFNELWIMSKINSFMSAWGYSLSGTCDVPLQNEYVYDFEEHEPSLTALEEQLKAVIFGVELEMERYNI